MGLCEGALPIVWIPEEPIGGCYRRNRRPPPIPARRKLDGVPMSQCFRIGLQGLILVRRILPFDRPL